MADMQVLSCNDSLSDIILGMPDGFLHRVTFCQTGGNGRGEGTARSVQITAFYLFLFIYGIWSRQYVGGRTCRLLPNDRLLLKGWYGNYPSIFQLLPAFPGYYEYFYP